MGSGAKGRARRDPNPDLIPVEIHRNPGRGQDHPAPDFHRTGKGWLEVGAAEMAGIGQPVFSHQLRYRLPHRPPGYPLPSQNRYKPGG